MTGDLKQIISGIPYAQQLGVTIERSVEGKARLVLPWVSSNANLYGVLHGGAIAGIIDVAGAVAAFSLVGAKSPLVTVDLNVTYIAAVQGVTVYADGTVLHRGKRLMVSDVEIVDDKGKLYAKGRVTYMLLEK